jgi:hypothetical protein
LAGRAPFILNGSLAIKLANAEHVVTDDMITSKYHHGQNLMRKQV